MQIAILGMVVSGLLAILKIIVGLKGHSAAVVADGFESAADVFSSGLVLVGLILAARPADENHPYGHGRAETLTGLLLGFFLLCAGLLIARQGLFGASDPLTPHWWALVPLIVSIFAKGGLVAVKHTQSRRIGSSSLRADAANDAIDMLSGTVALGALSLTLWKPMEFARADHYGAFAVGLIVIATSFRVMHEASLHLMDTMPDDVAMARVREVALGVRDVKGVEKCFARKTGLKYHVDLHLEVDPDITVQASHGIAKRVREKIREEIPWVADVLVHVEPWPGR
ncbi:MAG: cation diffusion facilitator family transporter [Acidobacteriota bacterium]